MRSLQKQLQNIRHRGTQRNEEKKAGLRMRRLFYLHACALARTQNAEKKSSMHVCVHLAAHDAGV